MDRPIQKLTAWFDELASSFSAKAPDPTKTDRILSAVEDYFKVRLTKYLGGGNNGVVFNTNDHTVIKFTIDNKEALLWAEIGETASTGINRPHKIAQLSSSETGDTIVYVVQTDYIPHPVTRPQAALIRQATQIARDEIAAKLSQMRVDKLQPAVRYKIRTTALVKAFANLAQQDRAFTDIPETLITLADKHSSHLFDLQPDNFRMRDDGMVTIVDPSVPDITKESARPEKLMFESVLALTLRCPTIVF